MLTTPDLTVVAGIVVVATLISVAVAVVVHHHRDGMAEYTRPTVGGEAGLCDVDGWPVEHTGAALDETTDEWVAAMHAQFANDDDAPLDPAEFDEWAAHVADMAAWNDRLDTAVADFQTRFVAALDAADARRSDPDVPRWSDLVEQDRRRTAEAAAEHRHLVQVITSDTAEWPAVREHALAGRST